MLRSQESVNLHDNVEIFVIDDDFDVRLTFQGFAEHENYITHTTANLSDTLIKLTERDLTKKFIFLIDFKLDGCNGVEVAEELCRRGVNGSYIIITGCEDLDMYTYKKKFESQTKTNLELNKDHCCNTIDEWLVKPISMQEFSRVIKKYV